MNQSLILLLCLSPLATIFIIMKFVVWMSAVNTESNYVGKEPFRKRGPFVADAYADVDEEEEEFGDRTDYQ
jgi:hypothetical protein